MARKGFFQAAFARPFNKRGLGVLGKDTARLMVQGSMLVLAVLYTLYFASEIVIPVIAALLLYQLLYGPVRGLNRIGVPLGLSAGLVLLVLLLLIGVGVQFLAQPADQWLRDAPTSLGELRRELASGDGPLDELRELGEEIDEITQMGEQSSDVPTVKIRAPGHLQTVTGALPVFFAGTIMAFLTCFFLLAQGNSLARALVSLGSTRESRRRISNVLRGISIQVSTYLSTVTTINVTLGIIVTLLLWRLGVPHPELWGVLAAILNFAPYLGPAVNAFILTVVGATTFDTLSEALVVPLTYLAVNFLEGMVLTPLILGRRVALSSLWVFLSVVFWGWMWGPIGALMAVPMMVSVSVFIRSWKESRPFVRQ